MPSLQAVVFDLDDTLYPERAFVQSGFQAVANWVQEHLSIPAPRVLSELLQIFNEGVRGSIFNHWLENYGLQPDDWVPHMVQVYRGHYPTIQPYPEVPGLLARLRLQYRLGLVTDGYKEVQKRKITALGIASYFDAVVFSDEWGKKSWKPSSTPFKIVLEMLGCKGPEAVYVADNPIKDFIGAKHVGMWTVRIRRVDGLYSHLEPPSPEYAPDFEINCMDDLEAILIQIGGKI